MSRFSQGPQGGRGVPPKPEPPPRSGRGGMSYPSGDVSTDLNRSRCSSILEERWPNYLVGGYFNDKGSLKIEYVSRCIPGDENLSDDQQHGVQRFALAMAHSEPKLSRTQLRRFFQHCRGLETRLKSGAAKWEELHAQFQFLDIAASDAHGKQPRKIPEIFYDFIRCNVAVVKAEKDFRQGFLPHFEALVGFGSGHLP